MSTGTKTSSGINPVERSDRPIDAGVNIGHVHLKTADIDRVHDFYVGILGFDVVTRIPQALFLSAGGYHHHLGFNTWRGPGVPPAPPHRAGLVRWTVELPTAEDVEAVRERLDDTEDFDGGFLARDPWGNAVAFVAA